MAEQIFTVERKSYISLLSKHSSYLSNTCQTLVQAKCYRAKTSNHAVIYHTTFSFRPGSPDELHILVHCHLKIKRELLFFFFCKKCLHCVFIFYCPYGFQDRRFSDEIDKLTGYKTKSLLCMPIRNSDGEIIGVAQAINKTSSGELFTEDDEKVILSLWL